MPRSGYTGISYPFRLNGVGGVAISTTSEDDATHIAESIIQILGTGYMERPMEGDKFYSNVDRFTFELGDDSMIELLRSQIVDDIRKLEPRVSINPSDVEIEMQEELGITYFYAKISFRVLKYETYYTARVRIGRSAA